MVASFTFETSSNEWRNYLHDINFWLNGYLNSDAYHNLERKLDHYGLSGWSVEWNIGVGPTCCFTRAISRITMEVKVKKRGPYDHVIEVDMKRAAKELPATRLSISNMLTIEVADKLGLLDQEYRRQKEQGYERWYYTYGDRGSLELEHLLRSIVPQIIQKLSTKKYLLLVENFDQPIKSIKLNAFTEDLLSFLLLSGKTLSGSFLPPPKMSMTRASQIMVASSNLLVDPDMVILTLSSLHHAAKYILSAMGHKDEQYWHHVAVRCFHYCTMLLVPHCSSLHGDGGQKSSAALADITSDELIRHWSAQGILEGDGDGADIYQVGNLILEAFREYSLLERSHFFPATTEAEEATKSAVHFLACHNLIVRGRIRLEHIQWISYIGCQMWHLSREWLTRQGSKGPTALVIKHCSQHSKLFMNLESDHFFAKLPYLRVLDLS